MDGILRSRFKDKEKITLSRLGPFEENTIVVGDCLDIMAQMPDGCVDLVVTDPPYNVGKGYDEWKDNLSDSEYWKTYARWMSEIYRVMMDGAIYISCLPRQLWDIRPLIKSIGFRFAQLLIWHGPNILRGTTVINLPWLPVYEPILMFWKGPRQAMLGDKEVKTFDVLTFTRPQRSYKGDLHRIHVTQKPIGLYKTLIARTPGTIVFDPFIGSGATAKAASRLGRTFFGCDINADSVKRALETLRSPADKPKEQLVLL